MTSCVYYIENRVNGKLYIGKTNDFDVRVKEHLKESRRANPAYPIHRAIKKYGIDNFELNAFAQFNTESEALLAERDWIGYLRASGYQLYNLTDGGDGISGFRHSEATKKHWSITRKGKMAGANHPLFGKPRPESVKDKSRQKQLGRKVPREIVERVRTANQGKVRSVEHCRAMSESRRGDGNPASKLTWEKVSTIRQLLAAGELTQDEIAIMFSIARTIVSRIKNNKIWIMADISVA